MKFIAPSELFGHGLTLERVKDHWWSRPQYEVYHYGKPSGFRNRVYEDALLHVSVLVEFEMRVEASRFRVGGFFQPNGHGTVTSTPEGDE